MEQFAWGADDGPMRPARLSVGIISAGRVGTALGVALERTGHVVVACSAISRASRQRAERRLHDTTVLPADDVAALANALGRVLDDESLARRLADNARERTLTEFTWRDAFVRYRSLMLPDAVA